MESRKSQKSELNILIKECKRMGLCLVSSDVIDKDNIKIEVDNEILTAYRNEMAAAIALAADQRDIKIKEIENKYRFNILPNTKFLRY